jgi:hypothetical protein
MCMKSIVSIGVSISAAMLMNGAALAAPCTVPNAITNGQIADASKVMDNLNAVADCAEAAVTTTGTPTTGSLPVFSGTGSITTGNLSGDVTTSGGTATTLSNSGVTAGTYVNPSIIIDAKGRITSAANGSGSGGGGNQSEVQWTIPPVSLFSWTNQGGMATATDTPFGIVIRDGIGTSGGNVRILDQPAPTTVPWTLYARITPFLGPSGSDSQAALVLRNSSSGRLLIIGSLGGAPGAFLTQRWNSPTAWNSTTLNVTLRQPFPLWISVNNDGVNITVSLSPNGFTWDNPVYTEAVSAYLGSIDRIGFGIQMSNRATGMIVNSFSTTAPLP